MKLEAAISALKQLRAPKEEKEVPKTEAYGKVEICNYGGFKLPIYVDEDGARYLYLDDIPMEALESDCFWEGYFSSRMVDHLVFGDSPKRSS